MTDESTAGRLELWADDRPIVPAIWLAMRLVLGVAFLRSGWEKLGDAGWTASPRGAAVEGFLNGVLSKAAQGGAHPEVGHWFAQLTEHVLLPHSTFFAYLIPLGELLVGGALIAGLFTRIAAVFGASMNLTYLFAGTTSVNPQMLLIAIAIALIGRRAGEFGLDRWALPIIRGRVGDRTSTGARLALGFAATVFMFWLALIVSDTTSWLVSMIVAGVVGVLTGWLSHRGTVASAPRPGHGLASEGRH
jgi:thiosulfate dehydrogenase [quinone] large subunit